MTHTDRRPTLLEQRRAVALALRSQDRAAAETLAVTSFREAVAACDTSGRGTATGTAAPASWTRRAIGSHR